MRKLRLSSELLGELTQDELNDVAGGTHLCATVQCTHDSCAAACYSLDPFRCPLTSPVRCLTATCV